MILRNALAGYLALTVNMAGSIVLAPLMLKHLGEASYGLWILYIGSVNFISLLDLGLAPALAKGVAARLAIGDYENAWRDTSTTLTMYIVLGLVALGVYCVMAGYAEEFFKLPHHLVAEAKAVPIILGVLISLQFVSRAFEASLMAAEHFYVVGMVECVVAVVRFLAVAGCLVLAGKDGLVPVALAHSFATVLGFMAIVVLCHRNVPLSHFPRPMWEWERAKAALSYGYRSILGNAGERLRHEGALLLSGSLLGPSAAAHFGVGLRLITYNLILGVNANAVATPRFSAMKATGNTEGTQALLIKATLYSSFLGCWLALLLFVLGRPFIYVWLSPAFEPGVVALHYLVAPVAVYMMVRPCEVFLLGIGRHMINSTVALIEGVVTILGCWWVMPRYGVAGGALVMAASLLLLRPWVLPARACRHAEMPLRRFWLKGPFRAIVSVGLPGAPVLWFAPQLPLNGFGGLAAAGTAITLLVVASVWLIGLPKSEKKEWKYRLAQLAARFRGQGDPEQP